MATKIERDFTAAGRNFTLHATAVTTNDGARLVGAHVTEEGTEELPYNGDFHRIDDGDYSWIALGRHADGVITRVTREAEEDAATCEHGLSASLCEGPGHYPADDLQF